MGDSGHRKLSVKYKFQNVQCYTAIRISHTAVSTASFSGKETIKN